MVLCCSDQRTTFSEHGAYIGLTHLQMLQVSDNAFYITCNSYNTTDRTDSIPKNASIIIHGSSRNTRTVSGMSNKYTVDLASSYSGYNLDANGLRLGNDALA